MANRQKVTYEIYTKSGEYLHRTGEVVKAFAPPADQSPTHFLVEYIGDDELKRQQWVEAGNVVFNPLDIPDIVGYLNQGVWDDES